VNLVKRRKHHPTGLPGTGKTRKKNVGGETRNIKDHGKKNTLPGRGEKNKKGSLSLRTKRKTRGKKKAQDAVRSAAETMVFNQWR